MEEAQKETAFKKFLGKSVPLSMALLIAFNSTLGVAIAQHYFYKAQLKNLVAYKEELNSGRDLAATIFPEGGMVLPVKWDDIGKRLVDLGVIDQEKFMNIFRGDPLNNSYYNKILAGEDDGYIVLTPENSRFVLNTLWALGLGQQNKVLTDMKMAYPQVGNLAATGGWTIAKGEAMDHYGKHSILDLSLGQQDLIKQIASNIYRPCCNNHTAFPDCNHGMAMLGLVEMMVAGGYSEDEIYASALNVNSVWFPDTYLTIAKYMEDKKGVLWEDVTPKEVLGADFSSGSGYKAILAQVSPVQGSGGGGSCGA